MIRRFITRPHYIILITSLLSFSLWLFPDFGYLRKGFDQGFSIFSFGFLLAVIWYTLACFSAKFGYLVGSRLSFKKKLIIKHVGFDSNLSYYFLSLIVTLGVLKTFLTLSDLVGGYQGIIFHLTNGTANTFRHSLEQVYKPGIFSLRYIAIHGAVVALIRRIILKKKSWLDFVNIFYLLLIALISSRLSIIISGLSFFLIYASYKELRVKPVKILIIFLLFFHLVSVLNYTRNINFYRNRGIENFYSAGVSEIITYVGVSFQGAIAVGERYSQILEEPKRWDNYASIERSLTANSSFLALYIRYNWFSFFFMATMLMLYAFLAGVFQNFKHTYLYLVYVTLIYAFAEFWRLFWFETGIMLTLVIIPIIIVFVVIALKMILPIWKK